MKKYLPILRNSPLFRGMTEAEIAELLPELGSRTAEYGRGAYILRAGEPVESLGIVLAGTALVIQEDYWGGRSLLAALGESQCFVETFACAPGLPLNVSVTTEGPAEILFLNVRQLLNQPGNHGAKLTRNLLTEMARKNVAFSQKLTHLGQRTTRAKLLSYLSAEASRQGRNEFDIPFSRQQLADYLLVERSGLSQSLCAMRDEGLLEFHKNHFLLK